MQRFTPILLSFILLCCCFEIAGQNVFGVDVYSGTGTIDWSLVSAAGNEFAWVKATEGFTFDDASFSTNMVNGQAAGVTMGAYHFARPDNNTALDEVSHFLAVAGDFIGPCFLPPVLDLENPNGSVVLENIFTSAQLTTWVNTWLTEVYAQAGVAPVVYTNPNYASYLTNAIDTDLYKLWIADPDGDPTSPPTNLGIWDDWVVKQYDWFGSVPGILGNADLNVFNGDFDDFEVFVDCATSLPENDDCASATFIIPATTCSYTQSTVIGATDSGDSQASCDAYTGNPHLKDVWFGFYVTCPGTHIIEIDPIGNTTYDVNYLDAVIELYASCNTSPIACEDDDGGGGGFTSMTVDNLVTGTPYYIRVYDYGNLSPAIGEFEICIIHEEDCSGGCTDVEACNYDSTTIADDGSCTYSGCAYPEACNYDSTAGCDDGSCYFQEGGVPCFMTSGCTYPDAPEYSSIADFDDGSCMFDSIESCAGDLNADCEINTADLLEFLIAFGTVCDPCN